VLYSLEDMSKPIFTIGFEGLKNGADIIAKRYLKTDNN
jgi:hypothetical protein